MKHLSLTSRNMHFNIIFFLETTLSKNSKPYVCTLVCFLNKQNAVNMLDEMFMFVIRQTTGCNLLTASFKLGWVRNQLVLRRTVKILIPSCANHLNVISADKLSPIYADN